MTLSQRLSTPAKCQNFASPWTEAVFLGFASCRQSRWGRFGLPLGWLLWWVHFVDWKTGSSAVVSSTLSKASQKEPQCVRMVCRHTRWTVHGFEWCHDTYVASRLEGNWWQGILWGLIFWWVSRSLCWSPFFFRKAKQMVVLRSGWSQLGSPPVTQEVVLRFSGQGGVDADSGSHCSHDTSCSTALERGKSQQWPTPKMSTEPSTKPSTTLNTKVRPRTQANTQPSTKPSPTKHP